MKTYKKWGMVFGIISLILGIISLVNVLMFFVMGLVTSNLPSETAGMIMMYTLFYIVVTSVLGIICGIIGIVGWTKKSVSVTGLVLSVLVFIPAVIFLSLFVLYK